MHFQPAQRGTHTFALRTYEKYRHGETLTLRCGSKRRMSVLQERDEHRNTLPILRILRMLGDEVALFELNRDQDVRRRGDREHQVRQRHGRRRPEREQQADVQRVTHDAIQPRRPKDTGLYG